MDPACDTNAILRILHRAGGMVIRATILLVVLVVSFPSSAADTRPFRVISASPAPDYALTADSRDLEQLTDQVLNAFPPWGQRASVGWTQATSVLLTGELRPVQAGDTYSSVRLFVSKGVYADVLPPSRIDVYCGGDSEKWLHAGELGVASDSLPDRTTGWLVVPLATPCRGGMALVIHARGAFLMIDEIAVEAAAARDAVAGSAQSPMRLARGDLVDDSKTRLRQQFDTEGRDALSASIAVGSTAADAWLAPAWTRLAPMSGGATPDTGGSLDIVLGPRQSPQYVIGFQNPEPHSREFQLSFQDGYASSVEVFQVLPVMAANGEQVFDALQPLPGVAVTVPPRGVGFVLMRHAPIRRPGDIRILARSGSEWQKELVVHAQILTSLPAVDAPPPDIGVWAYSSDLPIWGSGAKPQVVEFLRDAGVNVFVVHPGSIPQPGSDRDWARKEASLRADLRLYRGAGQVLLFLGWNGGVPGAPAGQLGSREAFSGWLSRLVAILQEEGYAYDQWALYPLDEPAGAQFADLEWITEWVKAERPSVRIYANPGAVSRADLAPGATLGRILDKIELWQPLLGEPADRLGPVLARRAGPAWWIYQVGRSPAKAIVPQCYRKLAWEAERRGAGGFGFWSFSDTGGSRAWDDLDGRRPDWAVVYEGPTGILSSRRWEAFKAGIQDFQLLRACSAAGRASQSGDAGDCARLRSSIDKQFEAASCLQ